MTVRLGGSVWCLALAAERRTSLWRPICLLRLVNVAGRPCVRAGGEADLDLGNYERFLDVTLTRDHNITTGKVYSQVPTTGRPPLDDHTAAA